MRNLQAFTLIEMAVVLVIIAFLIGGLLAPLTEQSRQQKIQTTQSMLLEAQEALLGFALTKGYLPCPDSTGDGRENRTASDQCDYEQIDGFLPWLDLGVKRTDSWGNPLRYRVDGYFSDNTGFPYPPQKTNASIKGIQIFDGQNNLINLVESQENSNVIALIFSCGQNGRPDGDNDADGQLNTSANCINPSSQSIKKNYVQANYVAESFDDIVVTLSIHTLIHRLTLAGKWPNCPTIPCQWVVP